MKCPLIAGFIGLPIPNVFVMHLEFSCVKRRHAGWNVRYWMHWGKSTIGFEFIRSSGNPFAT